MGRSWPRRSKRASRPEALRPLAAAALLALASSALAADVPARTGIETGDLDRSVAPCVDFFEFANGAWRAANPIPPSMVRWSRRWAAGETAKDQLNAILDGLSRPGPTGRRGASSSWSATTTARAWTRRASRLWAWSRSNPCSPRSTALADIGVVDKMIGRFHEMAIQVPFGLRASPDNHAPTRVIADVLASGLGLPDRDYYVKTEPRFQEAREKYRVHVAHLVELSGKSTCRVAPRGGGRLPHGEAARPGVARQRGPPRPEGHRPQDELRGPHGPRPELRLARLLRRREAAALRPQCPGTRVPEGHGPALPGDAPRLLEGVPPLAPRPVRRPAPLVALREGSLRLRGAVPRRGEGDEAPLETLRGVDGRRSRRGARPEVRREALPAGSEGPHAGAREEPAPRHGRHHPGARVDGTGDEGEGPREARDLQPEDRLSRQVEGLLRSAHRARRLLGERGGRDGSSTWTTNEARSASRWTAAGGG